MKTDKIKSYYVDGEAKDQEWIIANRKLLESSLHDDMREHGWMPVLDSAVNIVWDYVAERNIFKFRMEAKGVRVGRKKASENLGLLAQEGIIVGLDADTVLVAS